MTAQQWFRLFGLWFAISDSNGTIGTVSVFNPALQLVLDPAHAFQTALVLTKPPIDNPLGLEGFFAFMDRSPMFAYSDYLQNIAHPYSVGQLIVSFDYTNTDVVDHTPPIQAGAIVEIYDEWTPLVASPEPIGYGGPVRFPLT
jgi:hypothetical protein